MVTLSEDTPSKGLIQTMSVNKPAADSTTPEKYFETVQMDREVRFTRDNQTVITSDVVVSLSDWV